MQLREIKGVPIVAYPAIATTAVVLFLLRNRQITYGNSPGSGVTIALAELLVRVSAIVHWAASVGAHGLSLLLRVASAPVVLAYSALESEFRFTAGAVDGIGAFLQHASVYVLHALWIFS